MCCYSTREALILGGGFPNRLPGRYCFQRADNGFQDRCIMTVFQTAAEQNC
jgi:hypothetical protein